MKTRIAFMKTGNPNHRNMPKRHPVAPGKVNTMAFDTYSQLVTSY
jgi:hypothetical protein